VHPQGGPDGLGKMRQDLSIERIRFGQLPRGFGEVPYLTGIRHDDGQGRRDKRADQWALQAPGGL
jgi:hypothetical protein